MSVKVYGVWTTPATACQLSDDQCQCICIPDPKRQVIFLPDDECQGRWRPEGIFACTETAYRMSSNIAMTARREWECGFVDVLRL